MKVESLNYDGVTDQWKIDLLTSRAMRMGLRGQDLEDARQEIISAVIGFQYDAKKSNGASERTAMTGMIDNRLKMLKRNGSRYCKYLGLFEQASKQTYEPDEIKNSDIDVRLAIEQLSPEAQAVCRAFGLGHTRAEVRELLGIGRVKLDRIIQQIHDRFAGLCLNEIER